MTSSSPELGEVLARASELSGVRCIDVPTFVAALEVSGEAMEILRRCGVEAAALRAAVAASRAEPAPEQQGDEPFDLVMRACVKAAGIAAASSDRRGARSTDVLGALLHVRPLPVVVAELERLGMTLLRLRRVTAHGMADYPPPEPPAGELCAVRLHDDPFTTKELVVEVLGETFGLRKALAERLMLRTHEHHGVSFGPLPVALATACVDAAQRRASERNFPLRLTLEDVATVEERVDADDVDEPVPPEPGESGMAWERRADDAADRARGGVALALVVLGILVLSVLALMRGS